jgi:hypothetical protein
MRTKYAVLVAALSSAAFSTDALATACPAATAITQGTVSCTLYDNATSILIESEPTTTIYNIIDNRINLQESGAASSIFIESQPVTTINNIVDNSINLQPSDAAGAASSLSIESRPITTIYNIVENSINLQTNGAAGAASSIFIESQPVTTIYNLVDNRINLQTSDAAGATSSIFINSEPITTIFNLVDNSVNLQTSDAGVTSSIFIDSEPITTIYNLVDNSINLQTSGAANAASSIFIDSGPITTIFNFVDNSVEVTVAPEPASLPLLAFGLSALGLIRVKQRAERHCSSSSRALVRLRASFCSGRASSPVSGYGPSTTRVVFSSWRAPMRTRETSAAHDVWAVERRKAHGLLAFLWSVVDALDHVLTLARLRIIEALAGPLPETPANQQRAQKRAGSGSDRKGRTRDEPGAVVTLRADRLR